MCKQAGGYPFSGNKSKTGMSYKSRQYMLIPVAFYSLKNVLRKIMNTNSRTSYRTSLFHLGKASMRQCDCLKYTLAFSIGTLSYGTHNPAPGESFGGAIIWLFPLAFGFTYTTCFWNQTSHFIVIASLLILFLSSIVLASTSLHILDLFGHIVSLGPMFFGFYIY